MAGLSSNVTLGPGVGPIPGQINVPAGADDLTFGDAFAEARAARVDALDARDPVTRPVQPASPAAAGRSGATSAKPDSGVDASMPASIWRPISSSSRPSLKRATDGTPPDKSGATAGAGSRSVAGVASGLAARESRLKTGSGRPRLLSRSGAYGGLISGGCGRQVGGRLWGLGLKRRRLRGCRWGDQRRARCRGSDRDFGCGRDSDSGCGRLCYVGGFRSTGAGLDRAGILAGIGGIGNAFDAIRERLPAGGIGSPDGGGNRGDSGFRNRQCHRRASFGRSGRDSRHRPSR